MKPSNRPKLYIFAFLILLAVMNQNCSQNGFQGNTTSSLNSTSGIPDNPATTTSTTLPNSTTTTSPGRCNLPWGGSIAQGQSITAYQLSSVPYGQNCVSQVRVCSNGSLSGTYQYQSCYVQSSPGNGDISAAHPRLILDTKTLTRLRNNANANSPGWQALKAYCDNYVGGTTNYPDQDGYPNAPNVGQGYQGTGYLPIVLAEGLCYQVLKSTNPTLANTYGDKVVQILMAMSLPYPGSHSQNPLTDSGYGIRFYGQAYGIGYDWVYDRLTANQRTQIYTTANKWISAFEQGSFEYSHPQSNYFAGYFAAKAAIAIATDGENPSASTLWSDWLNNQYGKRVQPYYQLHLSGGGWPEGFGNYGPNALLNMSLPLWMVNTATGTDLIHASQPFDFPITVADYLMHFTWPSRNYIDDRDTNHANGSSVPVGTADSGMFKNVLGGLRYWSAPHANAFAQYSKEVISAVGDSGSCNKSGTEGNTCWSNFLFEDTGTVASLDTLPLSYFASGLNAVAARSDWTTNASWMSFRAGPYVNSPDQGEEGFDQGSLALVRGSTPLLVNASGQMVHEPNGATDEDKVYTDLYGSFSSTNLYSGNRQLYNVFYVRNMNGANLAEQFGQAAFTSEDHGVKTKISNYEDGGSYVYTLATNLEQMYRRFNAGAAVSSWSREIVYLRPSQFVVYDRTTTGSTSYDQYMAWHFPANPTTGSSSAGTNRLDVTSGAGFAGAMTTVLPTNASLSTTALYPTSATKKVWQVQVRPADSGVNQQWLTVFDLSSSSGTVAKASPLSLSQGNGLGVLMTSSSGNKVVICNNGAATTNMTGSLVYTIPNTTTQHVITEVPAGASYTVSVSISGGSKTVTVTPATGGNLKSSSQGVLSFTQ